MPNVDSSQAPDRIECPRCGEDVSLEHTICPHCGLNFYLPEANHWPEIEQDELSEATDSLAHQFLLVLMGWLITSGIAFLLFLVVRAVVRDPSWGDIWFAGLMVASTALGAWMAARYAQQAQLWIALSVSSVSIGTAILFDAFRQNLALVGVVRLESLLTWVAMLVIGAGLGWWQARQSLRVDHLLFTPASETEFYDQLLARLRYDRALLERLVTYERQRNPDGNRAQWLRSAIQRWERDNR
ncbi:MAG: 50S ribosomal protein L32 [Anaerolineales bacterium]|nr:50S ribosomal protein L32 [Anaerolineales bacterium]